MKSKQILKEDVFLFNETILQYFKDYCEENELEYSEKTFKKFVEFLKIDIPDWIKENFKNFDF